MWASSTPSGTVTGAVPEVAPSRAPLAILPEETESGARSPPQPETEDFLARVAAELKQACAFISTSPFSGSLLESTLRVRVTPPLSRLLPFPQLSYRTDGNHVNDGAGLGSPAYWFPGRLLFRDFMLPVREVLLKVVDTMNLASN